MDHRPSDSIEWTAAPGENFTGEVSFGPLSKVEGALNALSVRFAARARTDWHTHPDGQVLYVVSGTGRVQTEDGTTVDVAAGDVVYAPPGEVHWHGAGPDEPMTHLSLTTGGDTEWLPRPVTDEEYGRSGLNPHDEE